VSNLLRTSLIIPIYILDQSYVEMTQRCLSSLEYGRPDEIIVVDDGSPYEFDYKGWMLFQSFRCVIMEENKGYAGAVNAGLHRATGDILIVSNNDIEFVPGWLEAITKPLINGYDIASIRTSDSDGYETENKITEGDKFGSIWAMKRRSYEILGPLPEEFEKGYFEDLSYRRSAIEAGLRIAKNHSAVVEHQGRATFSEVDPGNRLFQENRKRYMDKWGFIE
jgi:glycosyltransferase involved in cell wall biosynthesis